jgi:ubiquitin-protein ligase
MQTMNRLNKELSELNSDSNFTVKVNESNNKIWNVSFKGVENTLYAGETFTLQFKFSDQYVKYINNIIAKR